jgi:hypothetical protein
VITGRVQDQHGEPVAGVRVRCRSQDPVTGRGVTRSTETGPGGTWRLEHLDAGEHELELRASGYYHQGLPVARIRARTGEDRAVELTKAGTLRVSVRRPDGEPLTPYTLWLVEKRSHALHERVGRRLEVRSPDGSCEQQMLPSFEHLTGIVVESPGSQILRVPCTGVDPYQDLDLGVVVTKVGEVLEGRVVDQEGRPVAGAQVTFVLLDRSRAERSLHAFPHHHRERTLTDATGRFRCASLYPRRYRILVEHERSTLDGPEVTLPREGPPLEVRVGTP